MRRICVMAFAICLVMAFGASSAVAGQGGGQGSDKPCPPASPVGQLGLGLGAPNCGNPPNGGGGGHGDTCKDGKDNDNDGLKDKKDPECNDPNDGVEDGSDIDKPDGVCENDDLTLLTDDAKILCVYFPPGMTDAKIKEACPGALLAVAGPAPLDGGVCLYLPPAGSEAPAIPGLPPLM